MNQQSQPDPTTSTSILNLKLLTGSVLIIVVLLGISLVFNIHQTAKRTLQVQGAETSKSVTVTVEGGNYYFNPNEIRVQKGETVKIVFQSLRGSHTFVVDEFQIKTPIVDAGQTATVEFIADTTGAFEFYSDMGQQRQMGMKGIFVVTEK